MIRKICNYEIGSQIWYDDGDRTRPRFTRDAVRGPVRFATTEEVFAVARVERASLYEGWVRAGLLPRRRPPSPSRPKA